MKLPPPPRTGLADDFRNFLEYNRTDTKPKQLSAIFLNRIEFVRIVVRI